LCVALTLGPSTGGEETLTRRFAPPSPAGKGFLKFSFSLWEKAPSVSEADEGQEKALTPP